MSIRAGGISGSGDPLAGNLLLDKQETEDDVECDGGKCGIEDSIVARRVVDSAADDGRDQKADGHGYAHISHSITDISPRTVDQQSQSDRPNDGGAETLEKPADEEQYD